MTGTIFNIQRYSINDGPGIRTTVFLKGCPLHCMWCHNPESISPEKEIIQREERCIRCGECFLRCNYLAVNSIDGEYVTDREVCAHCGRCVEVCYADARAVAGKEMTVEEVMIEIEKDIVFYNQSGGGVTFSGGEPLLQHEFLLSLLTACRSNNIYTAVDTSGYTSPTILEQVSNSVDLFLYDMKTLDDAIHKNFTGISNKLILENLRKLANWHKNIIVRIPIIPGINDNVEQIREMGKFISSLKQIQEIHVLPYHRTGTEKYRRPGLDYPMEYTIQPTQESLKNIVGELKLFVSNVLIGG